MRILIILLFCYGQASGQISIKDSLFSFRSSDSIFSLNFTIPQIKGMKNLKKQKLINEYIWNKIILTDSSIHSILKENELTAADLEEKKAVGDFPHSENSQSGQVLLLKDDFLCLEISQSYYYWGTPHGSYTAEFINLDLRTMKEVSFENFFEARANKVFAAYLADHLGINEDASDFELKGIVSLGVKDKCLCEKDYCVVFFVQSIADGFGYNYNEICLKKFTGALKRNSLLYKLSKESKD